MPNTHQLSIQQKTVKTGFTSSVLAGDDGAYNRGMKHNPRFIDNGDGTISDRSTGLMWVKSVPKMVVGAAGRVPNNQIQNFRAIWNNSTVYAIGDCARDPISGNIYICIVPHTSISGVDWASEGHSYSVGDKVKDNNNNTYWEVLTAHSSIYEKSYFNAGTYYNSGDIVKDPSSPNAYWSSDSSHTSISSPVTYSTSTYYNYGHLVQDPSTNDIYYYYNSGYTISSPSSWYSSSYYGSGDVVYISGYSSNGYNDGYYMCSSYHYSNDFVSDANSGYWSSGYYTTEFEVDRAVNSSYWTNSGYSDLFQLEKASHTWTEIAPSLFGVERYLNSSYWTSIPDTFSMSYQRTNNPTYWEQSTWTASSDSPYPSFNDLSSSLVKAEELNYAGYTDWRLPNFQELMSIAKFEVITGQFIDPIFEDIVPYSYWTSTQNFTGSYNFRAINFYDISLGVGYYLGTTIPILPVRGG